MDSVPNSVAGIHRLYDGCMWRVWAVVSHWGMQRSLTGSCLEAPPGTCLWCKEVLRGKPSPGWALLSLGRQEGRVGGSDKTWAGRPARMSTSEDLGRGDGEVAFFRATYGAWWVSRCRWESEGGVQADSCLLTWAPGWMQHPSLSEDIHGGGWEGAGGK